MKSDAVTVWVTIAHSSFYVELSVVYLFIFFGERCIAACNTEQSCAVVQYCMLCGIYLLDNSY